MRPTFNGGLVNGDFIKRHPGAVKEIADSGHETGSLFYYYFLNLLVLDCKPKGRFELSGNLIFADLVILWSLVSDFD